MEAPQPEGPKEMVFKTASGTVIPNNPTLPACQLSDFVARQNPGVDSHSGDSLWSGETMDYGMAVDGLLACQQREMFPRKRIGST